MFFVAYFASLLPPLVSFYLHGVYGDGEGWIVPVHLVLLAVFLVPHGALVCSSDAEHAQDDHEHQEADAHHDDDGGSARNHYEEVNHIRKNTVIS